MNPALAALLARPDIRRGDAFAAAPAPVLATGFPALDAELPGGGWARGELAELLVDGEGIGELALLMPALAALTAAGGRVLLVAPPHCAHAPAWAAAGVRLEALALVRPCRPRDALWAGVEALRCGGVAATLLWLDPLFRSGLPPASLRRLQVAAGEGGGAAFCFRPAQSAAVASPAPLRLALQPESGRLRVRLLKRRGPPARHELLLDPAPPAASVSGRFHALAGPPSPAAGTRRPGRVAA